MATGAIPKDRLSQLVTAVGKSGRFYGPVRSDEGVCLAPVSADDTLVLDYANFTLPPKREFFPRSEVIAAHGPDGMVETPPSDQSVVLFGIRPCDAMSLAFLDKVFVDEKFADPYYRRRRQRAVIISLACRNPAPTCFCTSVHGSPAGQRGADILAVDIGEALVLESVTEAGAAFLTEHADIVGKPTSAQVQARDAQVAGADKTVPPLPMAQAAAKLRACQDSPQWEAISQACLGCGVCTYLCPTCHCFGLYDEKVGGHSRRIRAQDACAFPQFTLEASGHNPRTRQGMRMRQRVMHKFSYAVDNFGDIFCVGCGRCIIHCPANLDIRETVTKVPQ